MRCARCNHLKVAEGRRFYCHACAPLARAEAQEKAMEKFLRRNPTYFRDVQRKRAKERGTWA